VPVSFILDFASGSLDDYDGVLADMQLGGHTPPNALYHAAGARDGGMRVWDTWESDAAFQEFAETKIGPITQAHGLPEPTIERIELAEARSGTDAPATFVQIVRLDGVDGDAFATLNAQVLPDGEMPEGGVFHVNGPTADGWIVIDSWTSREARDTFMATRVAPVMQSAGRSMPAIDDLDLHNTLTP